MLNQSLEMAPMVPFFLIPLNEMESIVAYTKSIQIYE